MPSATAAATASKADETFAKLNEKMLYTPKTSEGRGFLPPFLRGLGHLLYALGIADEELPKTKSATADKKATDAVKKVKDEITAAMGHLDKIEITDAFSSVARDQLVVFSSTLGALNKEFEGWDRDAQVNNLTSLVNKAFGITAMLDRELIGLRTSDPGSSL